MGAISQEQFEQQFRLVQIQVNELIGRLELGGGAGTGIQGGAVLPPRFTPVIPGVTPQATDLLRNGDLGHSVFTWNETSLPYTDPENQECVWAYSNVAPFNGQELNIENSFTDPGNPNTTLKTPDHADYDPAYCDWDSADGVARLNGTHTIDFPFPSNIGGPGKTLYIVFIAARRTQYISLPTPFRIYCGIWDNTIGQRDFIQASAAFTVNAEVVNSPSSTTERRYRLHARTDRGYTFLSDEVTVASAPSDVAFATDDPAPYVQLSWTQLPNNQGILSYDVYRYDVAANEYWLLAAATNGQRTYQDNNEALRQVSGYPTATYDRGIAYVATTSGNLTNLAVNGVSPAWSTLAVPIQLPPNYNQSNTTSEQWLRIGQNQAADVLVTAQITSGETSVNSPDGQFTVEMEGLMATFTEGGNTQTVELDTYISETEFTTVDPLTFSAKSASMLIIGGGFHGVLVDLIHASFQSGTTWSPNGEDLTRVLQPLAAPDGSFQGGTGIGGSGNEGGGDGGIRCLAEGYPVLTLTDGGKIFRTAVEMLNKFFTVKSETPLAPNFVYSNERHKCANIWRVATERWEIECSPTHPLITSQLDHRGVPVCNLKPGDLTLIELNGQISQEALTVCEATGKGGWVRQLSLYPRHNYVAGKAKRTFWQKLFRRNPVGGFVQSNVKPQQEPTQNVS